MPKQVPCPHCKKVTPYEGNPHRPFCSERCHLQDLGAWASGAYAITGTSGEVDETNLSSSEDAADREEQPLH